MPMRLDLFVKLKYDQILKYYLLLLNILCMTYFLTSITMHGPRYTSDTVNDAGASSGISSP